MFSASPKPHSFATRCSDDAPLSSAARGARRFHAQFFHRLRRRETGFCLERPREMARTHARALGHVADAMTRAEVAAHAIEQRLEAAARAVHLVDILPCLNAGNSYRF